MHRRPLRPLFLTALGLAALTSCHISNRGVDFSPLTDRFEPAVDDEVVLEGDMTSVSSPIAPPTDIAFTGSPVLTAPSAPAPTTSTPAAAPKPATEPAPVAGSAAYVVKAGDTLGAIARRSNTTVAQLCTANKLNAAAPLKIGQKLTLPAAGHAAKVTGKARTHTVQSGETLYAIARKHGVSPAALMQTNKLTPQTAGKLRIGSTLTIPAK